MTIQSIALALMVGLTLIAIGVAVVFGVKNIVTGKHEPIKIAVIFVPFVIFGILFAITGDLSLAGLSTLTTMSGLMVLVIVLGGIRSSIKF